MGGIVTRASISRSTVARGFLTRSDAKPAIRCPRCGSDRVHRSHRRNVFERLLASAGAQINRCQDCRMRQPWFLGYPLPFRLTATTRTR
jgi:predicted RNA-binding Zn-ribbon protein involved in translation (DUF1610 family)